MKKVLLILSLFCFVLFSATVAEVARQYIEPSETYTLTKISSGGDDYWIVTIEGTEEMVIDSTPSLVTGEDEIEDILMTQFEEEAMIESKRTQIQVFIFEFNESQYPERNTCEQYTGVDRMPCYDKESCLKSCYSVPICSMIKSEPFIFTILDWNNARIKVDESLSDVLNDLGTAKTSSHYSSLRSSINSLEEDMEDMENNGLYSVYGFCKNMNISYDSLDSAKSIISGIQSSLQSESSVRQKANSIYDLTTERINFISTRSTSYNAIYKKVSDAFSVCEENYKTSQVYDEDVELRLATASTYLNDISKSKNEGNYKVAIEKGNDYYSILQTLKVDINSFVVKRKEVNYEANKVMETYQKSVPILSKTKYDVNITFIRQEVEKTLGMKIISSELTNIKALMIQYNEQLKDMTSDCVLNGCEKLGNGNGNGNEEEEINETEEEVEEEVEVEKEEEVEIEKEEETETETETENAPSPIDSFIKTIISLINNLLGKISKLFGS